MLTRRHFEYLAAMLAEMKEGGTVEVERVETEVIRFARHYGANFDGARFNARVKSLRKSGEYWRYVK